MIAVRAKLPDALGFLLFVLRRWREDRCPQIAGSLTYTTLLALVPMFAIAVAVLSSAPIFEDVMNQIKIFLLLNLLPEIAYKLITVYMTEFAANAARLTWAGIVAVFVLSVTMLMLVDRSLNAIWRVRRTRALWRSVLGYALLLAVGPLLIGISVSITTYLMSPAVHVPGLSPEWHERALRIVPVAMSAATFFLMYVVIPQRHVPWRHALAGGVTAALLFESGKEAFAFYVSRAPTYDLVYGTFAAVPVFLIWVYLSWLVVLLGAELTVCLDFLGGNAWKSEPTAGRRFRAALAVARELMKASPRTVDVPRMREATQLPVHEVEDSLQHLESAGIARHEGRSAYALARAPGAITFAELYGAAVGPIGGMQPEEWAGISPAFARAAAEMATGLAQPLASLVERPAPVAALRKAKRGRTRSGRSSR